MSISKNFNCMYNYFNYPLFNYNWTNQVYNSHNYAAKIAKYSMMGIALVSAAETVTNITLVPLKLISSFYTSVREPIKKIVYKVADSAKEFYKKPWGKMIIGSTAAIVGAFLAYKAYESSWAQNKINEYLASSKCDEDYKRYAFAAAHLDSIGGKSNWFKEWQDHRIKGSCIPTRMFEGTQNAALGKAHLVIDTGSKFFKKYIDFFLPF